MNKLYQLKYADIRANLRALKALGRTAYGRLAVYIGLFAAVSMALGACASSTPKPLDDAQMTVAQAEKSHAREYAPTELQQAKRTLDRAEKAYDDNGDSEESRTMAYLAQRQAQQAMASAEVNYLATTRKARENELFARTDAQRRDYQQQLQAQRQQADMAHELSEQQLQQQRAELQRAMEDLEGERSNSAEMSELRAQYQRAMDQLDDEIQRRTSAEERMSQMSDRLAEIGDVRQSAQGTVVSLSSATLFENGKSDLLPAAREGLEKLADALQDDPNATLNVAGFTSSTGPRAFNQKLSEERAESVKDFLVQRGIDADRIQTVGHGEDQPIATNATAAGQAMNRRVEITVDSGEAIGGGPADSDERDQDDQFQGDPFQQNQQNEPSEQNQLPPADDIMPREGQMPGDSFDQGDSLDQFDRDEENQGIEGSDEDEDSIENSPRRDRPMRPGLDDDDEGVVPFDEPIDEF